MSAILATVNKFAGMVPPLVYVVALVVLVSSVALQTARLTSAHKDLGAAELAVAHAKGVNDHNSKTITELADANEACFNGRRIDEDNFTTARAKWETQREALEVLAKEVRTNEIEVYRDPSCSELARLDVSATCPALASGMRKRADRLNRIRDRYEGSRGSGAGAGEFANAPGDVRIPAGR